MNIKLARSEAENDFGRARGKALLSQLIHLLEPDQNDLLSLSDVTKILKPTGETYKGMQEVPIKQIMGSEGRYRDFTRYFLPRSEHLKNRWMSVDEARLTDVILPPIQLYEIGSVYFVRDGNHRVSVAKSQGMDYIDAEVTSLTSQIKVEPDMDLDEIKKAVITYEKDIFYTRTHYLEVTGDKHLDFSIPGQYDVIYNHILGHKYYLNQGVDEELPFATALRSWFVSVYEPLIQIIHDEKLCSHFPGRTPSDLYVWMVKHWDNLKQKYGSSLSMEEAAEDFTEKHGKHRNIFSQLFNFFGRRK